MATYVNNLRLKEIATGDESGTWGTSTNTNLELIGQALGYGTEAITTNADTHTSTVGDGASDEARAIYLKYTGTLDSACTITIGPNTMKRFQIIENATGGSQSIIISQGGGANITIGTGAVKAVYLDGAGSGAAVLDALVDLDLTGTTTAAAVTASGALTGGTVIAGSSSAGTTVSAGDIALKNGGTRSTVKFYCETSNAHYAQIQAPAHSSFSGNVTLTLPATTSNLVGDTVTQTLTNKTLTSPVLNTGVSGSAVLDSDTMSGASATKLASSESIKAYVDANISSVTASSTTTFTNKTLTSAVLNTGVSGSAVLDEDNLASDSNTKLATQQSIKAYVDNQVSGVTASSTTTFTNKTLTAAKIVDGGFLADANGNELIKMQTTSSAVNELELTNAATGGAVVVGTSGGDTNIDLTLTPKGTGEVNIAADNLNYAGTAVTSTGAELNILDGVTSTTAELNILDGVTSTAAELNILDGVTSTAAELNYLDIATLGLTAASKAVTADANGVITLDNGFSEEYAAVTSSSNVVSLDLRTAGNFSHDLTEATTVSFTNPAASGKVSAATLRIIQGSTARAITWNSSIKWAGDVAPTLSQADNAVDIFVFYTVDGGTTYYGFTAGQVMS